MDYSPTEENYLKSIFHLSQKEDPVSTNSISEDLKTKPASVSDMLRKLSDKNMLFYEKYKGVRLTPEGKAVALWLVRKHRLWEVFLLKTLGFSWDEVHDVAEQLEHIKSRTLIERLDKFLGFPQYDPHGDPIPDQFGNWHPISSVPLAEISPNTTCHVVSVSDADPAFLRYLGKVGISIGAKIEILDRIEFDGSIEIRIRELDNKLISKQIAENILVTILKK